MKHILIILAFVASVLATIGCKPSIPRQYIQPDVMAEILYDYHLADGVTTISTPGDTIALRAYKANILAKYKVTEAEFDSSLVYYERHTQMFEDVYQRLTERLNDRLASLGGGGYGGFADLSGSDTTNLWHEASHFILTPYVAANTYEFALEADTSYYAGDRLMLDFDAQYIFQDGMRDACAVMAVTYEGDSVEYATNQITSSSHYHLQINNTAHKRIKSVRGFWLINKGTSSDATSASTLKLLIVSNIRLVRMHVAEPAPTQGASGDSLLKVNPDSIKPVQNRLRRPGTNPQAP